MIDTNLREIRFEIGKFYFKEMHLIMPSAECRPHFPGLSVLKLDFISRVFVIFSDFSSNNLRLEHKSDNNSYLTYIYIRPIRL